MSATLTHAALRYRSDEELTAALVPYVTDGLRAGHAVIAVMPQHGSEVLRDALGADAPAVEFVDATSWYDRPARTIAGYHRVLDEQLAAGAPAVRVIGEVQFGPSEDDQRAWVRYESMLNRVFAERPASIVCPYDVRALPQPVLTAAALTHPLLAVDTGRMVESSTYLHPDQLLRQLPEVRKASPRPDPLLVHRQVNGNLESARVTLRQAARSVGMSDGRVQHLVLAGNEILTNAILHGSEPVELAAWTAEGELVCEISDAGPGIADPFAGFEPPPAERGPEGRMGLWIANQICDDVVLHSGEHGGTTVRMTFRL